MADVLLTVAICIIQLALGYMGVHVSLKPPLPKHHKLWIAGFILVALLGAGFTAWLAERSETAATLAATQIETMGQKLAHVHIHPTIGAYGVDDPTHLPKNWRPFMPGFEAAFRLNYENSSDTSTAEQVGAQGELMPVATKPNLELEFSKIQSRFSPPWRGDQLAPQDAKFITVRSGILSEGESQQIEKGTMVILLVAVIRFSDSTGDYEQDVCDWLQPHSLEVVWRSCGPQYESERKLK
jgi:hypothetical protein